MWNLVHPRPHIGSKFDLILTFIHPSTASKTEPLHRAAAVLPKDPADESTEKQEWAELLRSAPLDLQVPVAAASVPMNHHREKYPGPLLNVCVCVCRTLSESQGGQDQRRGTEGHEGRMDPSS